MKTPLSQLRLADWIVLCLALSVIGTILFVFVMLAYDMWGDDIVFRISNPYFVPFVLDELVFTGLLSLAVNVLGAIALGVFFTRKRRNHEG